jgi:phage regulator Rha-like protein
MSTLEIAGLTGKRHDHVVRDVRKMLQELDIKAYPQFWGKVSSEGGAPLNVGYLPKRECLILVSGYSVEMRC